jgi:hypothetical protein
MQKLLPATNKQDRFGCLTDMSSSRNLKILRPLHLLEQMFSCVSITLGVHLEGIVRPEQLKQAVILASKVLPYIFFFVLTFLVDQ